MTYQRGATWPKAATQRIRMLEHQVLQDAQAKDAATRTVEQHRRRMQSEGEARAWETFPWGTPEGRYILEQELAHLHELNPTPPGKGAQRLAQIDAELNARATALAARRSPARCMDMPAGVAA